MNSGEKFREHKMCGFSQNFLCETYLILRIIHQYLLTYCMVQSPPSEANWFPASQEIPHMSRGPR